VARVSEGAGDGVSADRLAGEREERGEPEPAEKDGARRRPWGGAGEDGPADEGVDEVEVEMEMDMDRGVSARPRAGGGVFCLPCEGEGEGGGRAEVLATGWGSSAKGSNRREGNWCCSDDVARRRRGLAGTYDGEGALLV
jgi:hypothetical protein